MSLITSSSFFPVIRLPNDLFFHLRDFLSRKDYRSFFNISKDLFHSRIRLQSVYYCLNEIYSTSYHFDAIFSQQLLQRVHSPSIQLSLKLERIKSDTFPAPPKLISGGRTCHLFSLSVCSSESLLLLWNFNSVITLSIDEFEGTEIPFLPNLQTLKIVKSARNLISVKNCYHLKELRLKKCFQLSDIAGMENIPKLSLNLCPMIKNISSLGNHDIVKLELCSKIEDVSSLAHVRQKVVLFDCNSLKNIEKLGSVPELICRWNSNLNTLPDMVSNEKLTINNCAFQFFDEIAVQSFVTEKRLSGFLCSCCGGQHQNCTINCMPIHSLPISPTTASVPSSIRRPFIGNLLQELSLENCNIQNHHLIHFSSCQVVKLKFCPLVEDISSLKSVGHSIDLHGLKTLTSLRGLGGRVPHLRICSCNELTSLEGLLDKDLKDQMTEYDRGEEAGDGQLKDGIGSRKEKSSTQSVVIDSCQKINSFSPLAHVPKVSIINCTQFNRIEELKFVNHVHIELCPFLLSIPLNSLQYCESISLIDCSKLRNVQGIQSIPCIRLKKCHSLKELSLLTVDKLDPEWWIDQRTPFFYQMIVLEDCNSLETLLGNHRLIFSLKIVRCGDFIRCSLIPTTSNNGRGGEKSTRTRRRRRRSRTRLFFRNNIGNFVEEDEASPFAFEYHEEDWNQDDDEDEDEEEKERERNIKERKLSRTLRQLRETVPRFEYLK
jgi:hypothetical protein